MAPRRLQAVVTRSDDWTYTRARPGSRMAAAEPLIGRAAGWTKPADNAALYGFRRNSAGRAATAA